MVQQFPAKVQSFQKEIAEWQAEMGARALELMNNPNEQATCRRLDGTCFGMSNQGMQWNQAKMMMSQPAPAPEEKQ